jgi:hypothetical protein
MEIVEYFRKIYKINNILFKLYIHKKCSEIQIY